MKKFLLAALALSLCCSVFGQSIYTKYATCPEGAVDLGIVMTHEDGTTYKVFWGKCNLGANQEEEVGDFYSWGEVEPKEIYNWDNYKYLDEKGSTPTKYHVPDPDNYIGPAMRLELDDDAAHVQLQGNWRIPTMGEWLALMNQCDWAYEKVGKHGGYRISSRENPENSIFLPIGGFRFIEELYDFGSEPAGQYWSSNVCLKSSDSAWYMNFNRLLVSQYQGVVYRYYGLNIRPVSE